MTTAKAKAPTASKKGAAVNKAPDTYRTTTLPKGLADSIAKGRGRPSAASQGLSPKRQYTRKVTPDILAIRRVGEALFGRNWKVDFSAAVQYDSGLITRILVGTRAVPDDMPKRIKKAVTEQRKAVTEALKSPLLAGRGTEAVFLTPENATEFEAIGKAVWGTYFKRDLAAAASLDPGLMTNAMKGARIAQFVPAELKAAIKQRSDALATLRNDPYLTPASPGEVQTAD